MADIHMLKRSYDGYCVGVGVEYPGIIVSAKSDAELVERFKAAIPAHKRALDEFKAEETPKEVVVTIDG